jgi:hypothetical protein
VPAALVAERTPASFDQRARERVGQSWVADNGGVVAGFVVVVEDEVDCDRALSRASPACRGFRRHPLLLSEGSP